MSAAVWLEALPALALTLADALWFFIFMFIFMFVLGLVAGRWWCRLTAVRFK